MEFSDLLDQFEKSVAEVGTFKSDTKAVRRAIKIVDELEQMDLPVMIDVPDVGALKAWLDTASGGDLSEQASKIQAALDVSDVLAIDESLVERGVKALEAYRGVAGGGSGSRYLGSAITMTLPDGKQRRSNKGDWTSIRNQAKQLTDLTKEDLNAVRGLLREGKNAEADGVKFTLG